MPPKFLWWLDQIFTRKRITMDTDFIESLQRGITAVGAVGLLGFCLYLLNHRKGS
jgi:hypothetical protein